MFRRILMTIYAFGLGGTLPAGAQIDPYARNLLQLGYDQPVSGRGPQAAYAYYYYNNPAYLRTNLALRLAVAPVYFDGELGFRQLLSPNTDVGLGLSGGGFSDNYYEVQHGHYLQDQSFDGYGGGASLHLYHLINPGQMIPLNVVAQGGFHYSTYAATDKTAVAFEVPNDYVNTYVRTGLRLAGKEPMLYQDLAVELSVWYERQWRLNDSIYGWAHDRRVQPTTDLYWLYAGLNYTWTNTGDQFILALTAGGSQNADRFSAWRLGGVLPLAAEFPLTVPGYYYQEISAQRFVHLSTSYAVPLDARRHWQLRLQAATALVDYLPDFAQSGRWHTGAGPELSFTSTRQAWRVILRYGYGFDALRSGHEGSHSVGVLCQINFGTEPAWKHMLR